MSSSYFDYTLPEDRIAQRPISGRVGARLLAFDGEIRDRHVHSLPEILQPGDLLVLNNSKVVKCRFFLELEGKECELFILKRIEDGHYQALARPMARFKPGLVIAIPGRNGELRATVVGRTDDQRQLVLRFEVNDSEVSKFMEESGMMPIPPYIRGGRSDSADRESYQTVYAQQEGSVAAPTAGLHLTPELLSQLRDRGVEIAELTLHVGLASILPLEEGARPGVEYFSIRREVMSRIAEAKVRGGRVVVVGTTSLRALESVALNPALVGEEFVPTELFIEPGFQFKMADVLMTNFHQPRSTHLKLVAAFVGEENIGKIYQHALGNGYRFLSYGDSSLLWRQG